MNSVKLYSNGSAVISKGVALDGKSPAKVSIPVRKADLDDVVSSISVFGNVQLPEPPSYTPTNSDPATLKIAPERVLRDLATKLRGAQAKVTLSSGKVHVGRVYGIQTYQQETNGSVFERFRVLLGTAEGIVQCDEENITLLQFTDAAVQEEIDKSLQASFQEIKPDSRFVDLTLVPQNGATEASVSYATPVAAWKIRYQLRVLKGVASLEGQAIVDNDTDDDWKDVNLSVITGEPISFSTDIAEIRRPARSRVNVVSDVAVGAVNADEAIRSRRSFAEAAGANKNSRSMAKTMACVAAPPGGSSAMGFESAQYCADNIEVVNDEDYYIPVRPAEAETKESGDFSIYTSPNPVTILSKKSAIIGLFSLPLEDARTVLLYKGDQNPRRPYRAMKFKNTTSNSLGKGVCEVYLEGDRQGKCVLEAAKKGEESLLIHAVETGVKVFREISPVEQKQISIRIKDGLVYSESLSTLKTTYKVDNSKPEEFDFDIECLRAYQGSKLDITVEEGQFTTVDTAKGQRISTKLAADGTLSVTVIETLVQSQQWAVYAEWLQCSIIDVKHPLARNKGINKVIELQEKVESLQEKIEESEEEVRTHTGEQERLLKLIPSVHAEQANQYKNDLNESEQAIRLLKKTTLPTLRKDLLKAEEDVQNALDSLKADWKDSDAPKNDEQDAK